MSKKDEAMKLALEALESGKNHGVAIDVLRRALAEPQEKYIYGTPLLDAMTGKANEALDKMAENARELGLDYEPAQQQKEGFALPGGGYVPAIPRPMPLDWKLVPRKATPEMLKAMDECAQEGYDERLYAGMASSVYMAAWDASPVMGTLPEQPAQQEPVADEVRCPECGYLTKHTEHIGCLRKQLNAINAFEQRNFAIVNMDKFPPAQRTWVGLTDEEVHALWMTGEANIAEEHHSVVAYEIEAKLKEKNT